MNILHRGWLRAQSAWFEMFRALRSRNYRLFFYSQLISWSGNWLQAATLGWLVKTVLHGSASSVALIAALPQVVAASGAFWIGFVTDRFDERKLLYITQSIQLAQACVLAWLTYTHQITYALIEALVIVMGVSNALDRPTTHALLMRITEAGEDRRSAVALNGSLIMAGASIGGLLASILIPLTGLGGAFIANAFSFIPIFVALARMELRTGEKKNDEHPVRAIVAGWKYLLKEKTLLFHILLNGLIFVVGFSYRAIFPVITTEVFHAGSRVNGNLYTATGIGALTGTCIVSRLAKELGKEDKLFRWFVIGGMFIAGISLLLLVITQALPAALLAIAVSSLGVILASSTLRGSIQDHIHNSMRGRVMGFLFTIFFGGIFLGNWCAGIIATHIGSLKTILIAGVLSIGVGAFLLMGRSFIFRKQRVESVVIPISTPA